MRSWRKLNRILRTSNINARSWRSFWPRKIGS